MSSLAWLPLTRVATEVGAADADVTTASTSRTITTPSTGGTASSLDTANEGQSRVLFRFVRLLHPYDAEKLHKWNRDQMALVATPL